jgi:hypothetical protein
MDRLVAGFLILVSLASAGCGRSPSKVPSKTAPAAEPVVSSVRKDDVEIRFERPSRDSLNTTPLAEIPDRLADIYRLQPDRRFLLAVAAAHRFFDGKAKRVVRLTFSEGRWTIYSDEEKVGELSEFAGYPESTRVLEQWARRLRETHPAPAEARSKPADWGEIEKRITEFEAPSLIAALAQLDDIWRSGSRDPRLFSLGARAYLRLCLQRLDVLEMADVLGARAWALLALSHGGAGGDAAERALLADNLDYSGDALELARALPTGHVIRDFLSRDRAGFLKRIDAEDDAFTKYLGLLTVAGEGRRALGSWGKPEIWEEWFRGHFAGKPVTLPILRTALVVNAFGSNPAVSDAILHESFLELSDRKPAGSESVPTDFGSNGMEQFVVWVRSLLQVKPQGLLRQFETRLASRRPAAEGPLWDAASFEAFHRGYFYSALFTLSLHYTERLASAPASQGFAEYLRDAPAGPAAQFARWYADHVAARYGAGPDSKRLIEDFSLLDRFGLPVLSRLYGDLEAHFQAAEIGRSDVLRPYAARLDSRLLHQLAFSGPAFWPLQDLKLTERLCRNLVAAFPAGSLADLTTCALILGREREVLALMDRTDIDIATRTNALRIAAARSLLTPSTVRGRFRKLLLESDYDRAVVRPYLLYLDGTEDDAEQQWLAEKFLARLKPSDGLLYSIYRARLAHAMDRQGHSKEAWAIIEPEIESGQGAVLDYAAEILWSLGRRDEAIAMARGAMERYPTSDLARATYAGILWRANRFSEAAFVLNWNAATQTIWRDTFAPEFERSFRKREDREAIQAFEEMISAKIQAPYLQPLADAVGKSRPDLAFELASRLRVQHGNLVVVGSLYQAYGYLKKAKGEEVAVRWLKDSIPQKMREPGGRVIFYDAGDFDLLWSVVEPPAGGELSSFTWLLRTVGEAYRGLDRSPHRAELLLRYANPLPSDFHHTVGRFLLGLEERSAVFRAATTADQRSEAAYFVGVHALIERHPRVAVDWFRAAIEIETEPSWEVMWFARDAITRFSGRYRPLEETAALW